MLSVTAMISNKQMFHIRWWQSRFSHLIPVHRSLCSFVVKRPTLTLTLTSTLTLEWWMRVGVHILCIHKETILTHESLKMNICNVILKGTFHPKAKILSSCTPSCCSKMFDIMFWNTKSSKRDVKMSFKNEQKVCNPWKSVWVTRLKGFTRHHTFNWHQT